MWLIMASGLILSGPQAELEWMGLRTISGDCRAPESDNVLGSPTACEIGEQGVWCYYTGKAIIEDRVGSVEALCAFRMVRPKCRQIWMIGGFHCDYTRISYREIDEDGMD